MPSSETNPSVLIIGYGNPLRGDDGVGRMVAQRLERILSSSTHDIRYPQQLSPELAEPISRAQIVIFIDATRHSEAGEISQRQLIPKPLSESLGHHVNPQGLLVLADELFGRHADAYAFTVGGEWWGYSECLSPKVESAVPVVIDRLMNLIARCPCTS
ncbi:hydrogenase [soil metagenome]